MAVPYDAADLDATIQSDAGSKRTNSFMRMTPGEQALLLGSAYDRMKAEGERLILTACMHDKRWKIYRVEVNLKGNWQNGNS